MDHARLKEEEESTTSTLELIGTMAVAAAAVSVVVVVAAPRWIGTALGGALTAVGARLLGKSLP